MFAAKCTSHRKQKEDGSVLNNNKSVQWRSIGPWLRLCHCATDDECKSAWLVLARAKDHEELDGRKSSEKPKSYYEVVAELFNDASNVHEMIVLPELHNDFKEMITPDAGHIPEQTKQRNI